MPPRSTPPDHDPSADPFDLWLRRSLHTRWDEALDERLPDDLLRLCSDDRVEWETIKARWFRTEGSDKS